MTYLYLCEKCDIETEVIKPMAESGRKEKCVQCKCVMQRVYTPAEIIGAKVVDAEYSPAFGKVLKNKRERQYMIDKTGAIEVGNEKPETVHKHFDTERERRREKKWEID